MIYFFGKSIRFRLHNPQSLTLATFCLDLIPAVGVADRVLQCEPCHAERDGYASGLETDNYRQGKDGDFINSV